VSFVRSFTHFHNSIVVVTVVVSRQSVDYSVAHHTRVSLSHSLSLTEQEYNTQYAARQQTEQEEPSGASLLLLLLLVWQRVADHVKLV